MRQSKGAESRLEVFFFFLSQLLEKKVYAKDGILLGRFTDIVASLDYKYPEIEGFVLSKARRRSIHPVADISMKRLAVSKWTTVEHEEISHFEPRDRHFFVRDVLYDRQIVDVNGAKVERVNDVRIISRWGKAYVAHVDVGFTGLVRRLGFGGPVSRVARAIGAGLRDELIDWRFVQPLPETYTSPVSVKLRQEEIKRLHPGELADILEELDRDERIALVQSIGTEDAADALEEAHINVQTSILRDLNTELAADILEEMEPAVAADVIEKLPAQAQESIMAAMEDEDRAQIEILIHAKEESAASLMTVDFISCPESYKVAEALALIREYADKVESITYVYCTDEDMQLRGVVSIRELILASEATPLFDLMNRRLVTLSIDDDWDVVAGQFLKLKFRALPVVDGEGRILGIVTFLHSFNELLPFYNKLAA